MPELTTFLRELPRCRSGRGTPHQDGEPQTTSDSPAELKIQRSARWLEFVRPDTNEEGTAQKESSGDLQRDLLASVTE